MKNTHDIFSPLMKENEGVEFSYFIFTCYFSRYLYYNRVLNFYMGVGVARLLRFHFLVTHIINPITIKIIVIMVALPMGYTKYLF